MKPVLQAQEIGLAFGGVQALNGFSADIYPHRLTALVGPNGAGKTTFFNVLTGLLRVKHGRILFKNRNMTRWTGDRIAREGVARTFQDLRLIAGISVLDNVVLAKKNQAGESFLGAVLGTTKWAAEERCNRKEAAEVLKRVGLQDCENQSPRDLSFGQQKLLTVACCLFTGAELLLLDEPFSAIHPTLVEALMALLRELIVEGKAVIFIEHDLEVVRRLADEVIVMDHGSMVAHGQPADVLKQPEIMETYYL